MLPSQLRLRFVFLSTLPLKRFLKKDAVQRMHLKSLYMHFLFLKLLLTKFKQVTFILRTKNSMRHLFMTTRAPYRYKGTRNQYLLQRYRYELVLACPLRCWIGLDSCLPTLRMLINYLGRLDLAHVTLGSVLTQLTYQPLVSITPNGRT